MSEDFIEHTIKKETEHIYGYLMWSPDDKKKFESVFPEGEFEVIFKGIKVPNRRVDWERNRICLYPVKEKIKKGETLEIRYREGGRVIIESKR